MFKMLRRCGLEERRGRPSPRRLRSWPIAEFQIDTVRSPSPQRDTGLAISAESGARQSGVVTAGSPRNMVIRLGRPRARRRVQTIVA